MYVIVHLFREGLQQNTNIVDVITQAATLMIAERAATMILNELKSEHGVPMSNETQSDQNQD